MTCDILDLFCKRHSFYELNNILPIDHSDFEQLIKKNLALYPSAFNAQPARIVILWDHLQFWNIIKQALLNVAQPEAFEKIENKILGFASGAGTLLFFIDDSTIKQQKKKFPLYASNIKNWAYQSCAILQYMIWTTLANRNIGASLQHYNPLINESIQHAFDLPSNWELVAQMPFGGIDKIPLPHPTIGNTLRIIK
jgi:hypothetical protein